MRFSVTRIIGHIVHDGRAASIKARPCARSGALREAGAQDQVTALLVRDPAAHAALDNPWSVLHLLDALREAGAQDQVTVLLARVAGHAALDDPAGVAALLRGLRVVGAQDQVTVLLARVAGHAALDHPAGVAVLLDALREAGAHKQAALLADRLPGEGLFELFWSQGNNQALYRFGREPDGNPARSWGWDDLN